MNYKKWVYDELGNYHYRKQSLRLIPEKIKNLQQQAETIRAASFDSTHVSGTKAVTAEDLLLANVAERQQLERNLKDNEAFIRLVDTALDALPREERKALEYCVLFPASGGIRALQEELGYEKSQAYAIKDRAIHHIAVLLHGNAEM